MENLISDLRYGFRLLLQKPSISILAITTLAVGIGANTAIFSVVDGVVLRPLPYEEPEELVMVWQDHTRLDGPATEWASPDNFFDWRDQNDVFEGMFAIGGFRRTLTGRDVPEVVTGAVASHDVLSILGVEPIHGRGFTPDEDVAGAPRTILLGYEFWQRRFEGSTAVVGEAIILNETPTTVVGILPPSLTLPVVGEVDALAPLRLDSTNSCGRGCVTLRVVARLRDGVALSRARSEMNTVATRLENDYPNENSGVGVHLVPLHEDVVGPVRAGLFLLLGAVGLVLLIACANVASLMLTRAADRGREVATRVAIGASRRRLLAQMLTESLVLAALGSALGVVLAMWGVWFLQSMVPAEVPRFGDVTVDGRALAFTVMSGILAGVLFGLVPALRASKPDVAGSLKEGARGSGVGSIRFRNALVIAEVAVALALLIGSGLLIQSFSTLMNVDMGFSTDDVLTARLSLTGASYEEPEQRNAFVGRLLSNVSALPGVSGASVINVLPLGGNNADAGFRIEGRPPPRPNQGPVAWYRPVSPEYFDTMGVRIVEGRGFLATDDSEASPVVLINEAARKRYWGEDDPLLTMVEFGRQRRQIVGIVADTKHFGLDTSERPAMYLPYQQLPSRNMSLMVASGTEPQALTAGIRAAVSELDPTLAVSNVMTMKELIARSVARPRMVTTLLATFALVALTLAAIGLYGVMSYSVRSRTQEIGLRIALGASTGDVLKGAVGRGMALMLAGSALGLVAAFVLTRYMESLLFGVSRTDPMSFVLGPSILGLVALVACYVPARRAARVDPVVALRNE